MKVGGIIVTYFPENRIMEVLSSAFEQLPILTIFDNTTDENFFLKFLESLTELHKLKFGKKELVVIHDGKNHGLPFAYNSLINVLNDKGFEFALLLDQDTLISRNLVKTLVTQYFNKRKLFKIGALGPKVNQLLRGPLDPFFDGGFKWNGTYEDREVVSRKFLINSGMLIPISVLKKVGQFDESYFTDSLDHEMSLRLRTNGYFLLEVKGAHIDHNIYQELSIKFGKVKIGFDAHRAKLEYYCARDTFKTSFKYFRFNKVDSILLFSVILIKMVGLIFFYPNKRVRLYYFFKGMKDSLSSS